MAKKNNSDARTKALTRRVDQLVLDIYDILPQPLQESTTLDDIYQKNIDSKSTRKQFELLPVQIQKQLTDDRLPDSESHPIFIEHIVIPILEQKLKQQKQKCEIGALTAKITRSEINSFFTDPESRQEVLETFADDNGLDKYIDIFDMQTKMNRKQSGIPCIHDRLGTPIKASRQTTQSKYIPDLSKFIVIGTIDCSGYKMPKTDTEATELLKILPLAVVGKLDCSKWDKELFNKITKLPMVEILDCSYSINNLTDLIGKLPDVLTTLVVQDALIKENSLKKNDKNQMDAAKEFIKAYPNVHVIALDKSGHEIANLHQSIENINNQEKQENESQKHKQEPAKTVVADKTPADISLFLSITDAYKQFLADTNTPQKLVSRKDFSDFIKRKFGNKIKNPLDSGQNFIYKTDYEQIKSAYVAFLDNRDKETENTPVEPVQSPVEKNEKTKPEVIEQKTEQQTVSVPHQIRKFIATSDLKTLPEHGEPDNQEKLKDCINKFNVWNQRNINNGPCVYIDDNGKEQVLRGMTCRSTDMYSYGVGKARVDFLSTTLKDVNGNDVLDENGQSIYVLVSVGSISEHKRGRSDKRTNKHNDIIQKGILYVTDQELTKDQQNTIKSKLPGMMVFFKSLPELELSQKYLSYVYPEPKEAVTKNSVRELSAADAFQPVFQQSQTLQQWADGYGVSPDFMLYVFSKIQDAKKPDFDITFAQPDIYTIRLVSSNRDNGSVKDWLTPYVQLLKSSTITPDMVIDGYYDHFSEYFDNREKFKTFLLNKCDEFVKNGNDDALQHFHKFGNSIFFDNNKIEDFLVDYILSTVSNRHHAVTTTEQQPIKKTVEQSDNWISLTDLANKLTEESANNSDVITLQQISQRNNHIKTVSDDATVAKIKKWFQNNMFDANNMEEYMALFFSKKRKRKTTTQPVVEKPQPELITEPKKDLVYVIGLDASVKSMIKSIQQELDTANKRVAKNEKYVAEANKETTRISNKYNEIVTMALSEKDTAKRTDLLNQAQQANTEIAQAEEHVKHAIAELDKAKHDRDSVKVKFDMANDLLKQRHNNLQEKANIKEQIANLEQEANKKEQKATELGKKIILLLGGHGPHND